MDINNITRNFYRFLNEGRAEAFRDAYYPEIDDYILNNTEFKKGERIIIVGSIPKLISGRTNFIRVHRIGAALESCG